MSQPASTPAVDQTSVADKVNKPKRGRPRKTASGAKNSVEPEVINQKLKAIAGIEDKAAAAYADDTTPGGPSEKAKTKKRGGSTGLQKSTVVTVATPDGSEFKGGTETEGEGTVWKKGKGVKNYRKAIQAIRNCAGC